MRKFATWIFSVALVALLAASPAFADALMKKNTAAASSAKAAVALKAAIAPHKSSKGKTGIRGLDRVRHSSSKGFGVKKNRPSAIRQRGIAKASSDLPEIYGTVSFSDDTKDLGLYIIPTNPSMNFDMVFPMDFDANYGGAVKDGVYYINYYYDLWGFIQYFYAQGYDLETGEVVYDKDLSSDPSVMCPGGMASDPLTGDIYGICFTDDLSGQQLAKINYTEAGVTKNVIYSYGDSRWFVAFAIDGSGQFYGIETDASGEGILYKIDRTTGATTRVGATGQYPYYITGCCIDPKSGRMFWAVCPEDDSGFITEVSLATGAAEVLYNFPYNDEVTGMFIPAAQAEDGAPAGCEDVEANFTDDSLSGTITFTAPSTKYDGTALTGNVTVTLQVNGENFATKEVAAGAAGSFDVTMTAAGLYTFTVYASNSAGNGPKASVKDIWVGADSPAATTATATYANGNMEITWLPVTAGVNGGYISDVTYTVKDQDGTTLAEGLTVTSYSFALEAPVAITAYYYDVYAVAGGLTSAAARTNTVMLGSIVPPYVADFAQDGLEGWTVIDGNSDNKVWTVEPNGAVKMSYNTNADMDDWLITPPLSLDGGKSYEVSFVSYAQSDSFPERLEVKWGNNNTAAAMTNTLLAPTVITEDVYEPAEFSEMLIPESDGVYYIGFHGISDADQYYLYIKDIQIAAGVSADAPGMATNLTAVPVRENGAWVCNVSFNAPSTTMGGATLSNLTKVELYRGETLINTWTDAAPGAALSYADSGASKETTYQVIGYNESGRGLVATTSTFVGIDSPAAPAEVLVNRTANPGEVTVTWTPVTADINGLPLATGDVTYQVAVYDSGWEPVSDILPGTTTSYTFQAVEEGEQTFLQAAVFVYTSGGENGEVSDMVAVGTPYDGLDETFSNGLTYIWGYSGIGGGTVRFCDDETLTGITSVTGDNGFIGFYGQYLDDGANLFSGMISLEGIVNPGLTFYTYNIFGDEGDEDINEIAVSVREVGATDWTVLMQPTAVDELCDGQAGWNPVTVSLADYVNKVVEIQFTAVTKYYTYTLLDDIKVGSILGHDMAAVSIYAPSKAKAGENYSVDVTVRNEGAQTATGYSVCLFVNGELSANEEGASLESGKSAKFTFDLTMSQVETEPVEIYAVVEYPADENEANNQTATLSVTPVVPNLPVAVELEGELSDYDVVLTWTEPNLEGGVPEEVTDDFEDADGIVAEYGDWKFYDGDGSEVGGFQNMDIPGITVGQTKGSFWVWDNDILAGNQTFDAHSGVHYLFALFRYDDGTTDDWAISPELYGGRQTISFYAKSYSAQYPEKIEVYYSTGSENVADFIRVEGTLVNAVPDVWTQYTADLPDGARYFAIRSFATGSFMLMIDDVTYTPAGIAADLEIAGYNVYRNGVKINEELIEETRYVDTPDVDGEYTYVVTVVYTDKGESGASNAVTLSYDTNSVGNVDGALRVFTDARNIVVVNAEGLQVTVADAAGRVLFNGIGSARNSVAVNSGVYVVKAGKTVRKVIVK